MPRALLPHQIRYQIKSLPEAWQSVHRYDPTKPEVSGKIRMNVTALIVAYYGDSWLPACIDSLAEASTQRIHLVLVDNAGNTGFDTLGLERFDTEVIKTPYPMGFAEANNYALAHATRLEEAVLFLNQDTISATGWIDRCLDCLTWGEEMGAVSPLIYTYDGSGWDPGFLACVTAEEALDQLSAYDAAGADWFATTIASAPALIVRTEALRCAGPFDPVFGSYYEDYDLCRRIRDCGYDIAFCRSATINHYSGSTTNSPERERKRMRQIIRNRILYTLRVSGSPRLPQVARHVALDFPRRLLRGLLRTPSSQPPLVTLKAYGDLLRIAGRVVSRRRDEDAWQRYLDELGWPHRIPGFITHASADQYA